MTDPLYEQRRYTALVFHHSRIADYRSLKQYLGRMRHSTRVNLRDSPEWKASRFDYFAPISLYPDRLKPTTEENEGFPHSMYFAVRRGLHVASDPVVVIASPYVRLLNKIARELRSALPGPAPRFLTLDMGCVHEALRKDVPGLRATRVTMQILNEPSLELVSLAGKNPLRSELHEALKEVAAPYSIRAEVEGRTGKVRISADRHGNLWWYQSEESRFERPLQLIDRLAGFGAIKWGLSIPLDRVGEDDSQ